MFRLRERGTTVLMSSHILTEVDPLGTPIGIVHRGVSSKNWTDAANDIYSSCLRPERVGAHGEREQIEIVVLSSAVGR